MKWTKQPTTKVSRNSRALGVELLDDRRLLSATPLGVGDAGYPNPFEDDDLGPIGPVAQVSEIAYSDLANSIRSGSLGYPAPDDDGDWGPLGPVVRDAITAAVESLGYLDPSRVFVSSVRTSEPDPEPWNVTEIPLSSTNVFPYNPNPEDDGDLGPIGPVVNVFVADSFSNVASRSGGGSFYPNPEDDGGGWGPIGPVVHVFVADSFSNVSEQSDIVARSGGGGFYPNPEDDDGGGWGPIGPVIDVLVDADRLVVIASPEVSQGDGFYPNPEDDDDLGPLGPVVKQVTELDRAIGEVADGSASYQRADATDKLAIRDQAFASVDTVVARRSLRG